MARNKSRGWSVQITHPQTGRVIRPDVLDEPQFIPSLNSLPEVRVPVRRAPSWLREDFDNEPDMAVYLDGNELPIDELVDVEDQQGRTVLVGEGGVELRDRVSAEYRTERRHIAARDLINSETSYDTDVDTPTSDIDSGVVFQDVSGESELGQILDAQDDEPLIEANGGIKPAQTLFFSEGEDNDDNSGAGVETNTNASGGEVFNLEVSNGFIEWNFTPQYTIPADNVEVAWRDGTDAQSSWEWTLNGDTIESLSDSPSSVSLQWRGSGSDTGLSISGSASYDGGDLQAGTTYTLRVEALQGSEYLVDAIAVYDSQYTYTFDETLDANDALEGPELHPQVTEANFDPETSAFAVIAGSVESTFDSTVNDQFVALSNDFGDTFPIREDNSETASGNFPNDGAALQLRAGLSRYSPSGTRTITPTNGYDAQTISAFTTRADIRLESLLIDQKFDDSLESVLNEIAGEEYVWSYQIQGGTPTIAWAEPGQRVADSDPDLEDAKITKRSETWDRVTIKGSNQSVSGEQFTASTSFVDLVEDDILTGSESVFDDSTGQQFTRGVDYEMDYDGGQIRVLSGGDISTGDEFSVDYQYEIEGTYPDVNDPEVELVETVPGVVSDRQAEQIAFAVFEVEPAVDTPRYEGDIVVPRVDATFDPLEALNLAQLDLPSVARPLSIRGSPEITPRGLALRLGSAPRLESQLSSIRDRVQAVSQRV